MMPTEVWSHSLRATVWNHYWVLGETLMTKTGDSGKNQVLLRSTHLRLTRLQVLVGTAESAEQRPSVIVIELCKARTGGWGP